MALSFASRVQYVDRGKEEYSVHVQSSKCWYNVAITQEGVFLIGPGIEQKIDREDFPEDISMEGLALLVVIQWEERI